jgi:hypothetical protein
VTSSTGGIGGQAQNGKLGFAIWYLPPTPRSFLGFDTATKKHNRRSAVTAMQSRLWLIPCRSVKPSQTIILMIFCVSWKKLKLAISLRLGRKSAL